MAIRYELYCIIKDRQIRIYILLYFGVSSQTPGQPLIAQKVPDVSVGDLRTTSFYRRDAYKNMTWLKGPKEGAVHKLRLQEEGGR